jgi:hypothetical protein
MDLNGKLLRVVLESVVRELDDDALTTLRNHGIKGSPGDECGCPVANYVRQRLEALYDTVRAGRYVVVSVYFDQLEANIYSRSEWLVGATVRDRHVDMGAFAFVHRFDERAKIKASPYAALVS